MQEPVIRPLIDIPHIAGLAQVMVRKALDAFVNRDADLARSVLASDDAVDNMRTASYHELISFMEKNPQHIPQALYLLSVVRNLERIADHSTNIAEDVLFLVKGIDVRHHNERYATLPVNPGIAAMSAAEVRCDGALMPKACYISGVDLQFSNRIFPTNSRLRRR